MVRDRDTIALETARIIEDIFARKHAGGRVQRIAKVQVAILAALDEAGILPTGMTEAQIKHMVDRFLGWKLPDDFCPDAGISFKKTHSEQGPHGSQKYEPIGTNLFDATQADAMVRHLVQSLPKSDA
jgi:hypothetical protein